jgi:FdhE protein
MAQSEWHKRIARAEELRSQYTSAAEILRFYIAVARFQEKLHREFNRPQLKITASPAEVFSRPLHPNLISQFEPFLSLVEVEQSAPGPLSQAASELRASGEASHLQLLTTFWNAPNTASVPPGAQDFFARAFLQPYAELLRSHSILHWTGPAPYLCPFCQRKPGLGILRPLGEGSQRSLVCSFCLAEWEFRRIVCPGCGEENYQKLPVYTAEELKHVRVESCDTCRTYIKTVDLTKNGRAEPLIDEMAAIPLDLWAQNQGYAKLQSNLMQL